MDKQNTNNKNRKSLRANEPVDFGNLEILKNFLKSLAILVVFISSLLVPLYLSYKTQQNAKVMRVRMDMNQLKNWTKIYELENSNYFGLEDDEEIKRVFEDIKSMGGLSVIFVSNDYTSFCCRTNFSNTRLKNWCIDSLGHVGDDGKCSTNHIQCD
jgi:hypothetical protein